MANITRQNVNAGGIPLYGANKDGGALDDWISMLSEARVEYEIHVSDANGLADTAFYTCASAEGDTVIGGFVEVSNCKDANGAAGGDAQVLIEFNTVDDASRYGGITTAGTNGRYFFGGGDLANAESIEAEFTGTANNSFDLRIVTFVFPNANLS
tara:strand:- start:38 stop:502 length:465 start_codon:yes stop_codon:yes gene_type:complete